MDPIVVPTATALHVTYSLHEAARPTSQQAIVLHHGICHTRSHFCRLIDALNKAGLHVAMVDQQSQGAGLLRNAIDLTAYREGMAAAVRRIERVMPIGSYALHSMGALIGEEMQQHRPELRRPTVLMAPIPVAGAVPITLRILWNRPGDYLKAALKLDIQSLAASPHHARELFFDEHTAQEIVDQAKQELRHAPFWVYCQLVLRWMLRPRVANHRKAMLLLSSETDRIFEPWEYERTIARYPQLERHAIAGGHDFFIQNAEQTAQLIADFHLRLERAARDDAAASPPAQPRIPPPHIPLGPARLPAARTRFGSRLSRFWA